MQKQKLQDDASVLNLGVALCMTATFLLALPTSSCTPGRNTPKFKEASLEPTWNKSRMQPFEQGCVAALMLDSDLSLRHRALHPVESKSAATDPSTLAKPLPLRHFSGKAESFSHKPRGPDLLHSRTSWEDGDAV